ncbi:MAG: hypothetical protein LBR00_05815, partial [Clostridiales Family XIII bacterium]|nr:hypothetical protein [Clostridiales Family XIII bacterium]
MRISADMLRRGLEELGVAVTVFGNVDGGLSLSRVLFAGTGDVFEDGAVYLIEGAERPGDGGVIPKKTGKGDGAARREGKI